MSWNYFKKLFHVVNRKNPDKYKTDLGERRWVYNHRLSQFEILKGSAPIIMIGDSLTENGECNELLPGYQILNRGISSDTVEGLENRLYEIISRKPDIVVGLIGINDIAKGMDSLELFEAILSIIKKLQHENITLLWQSILYTAPPRNISNESIRKVNYLLQEHLVECGASYLDINQILSEEGVLSHEVSEDGLHLNGEGYRRWANAIELWFEEHQSYIKIEA